MEKQDARPDPWHLQRRIGETEAAGISDGELLAQVAAHRDEAAFELLVWRHHRLVLSVCRKTLRDSHLADDAFQATFLILARKAGTISLRERRTDSRPNSNRRRHCKTAAGWTICVYLSRNLETWTEAPMGWSPCCRGGGLFAVTDRDGLRSYN